MSEQIAAPARAKNLAGPQGQRIRYIPRLPTRYAGKYNRVAGTARQSVAGSSQRVLMASPGSELLPDWGSASTTSRKSSVPKSPAGSLATPDRFQTRPTTKTLLSLEHSGCVNMASITRTDSIDLPHSEKPSSQVLQVEDLKTMDTLENLAYTDAEEEPELHARTYVALLAMFILNLVQVVALQGPPAVLNYIGKDLENPAAQTWVPNSLSLVQAVLSPIMSSASDTFQARKLLLVGSAVVSFIGSAIAPGSGNIYRLVVAQILIGVGFASVSLAYAVPSEILPRRWRPMVQALINVAACLGALSGPLIIGAFTKADPVNGWRKFYWIQMALWGVAALGIFFGYRPPKRHTRLDHLSFWQKLRHLDLPGCALLTTGLTLFLTGLNLGGGLYTWTNARTLATLIAGIAILIFFGGYEWKGTKTGILHHDLFRGGKAEGRTFALCVGLIFIEGILLFSFIIFYPVLTEALFETDPLRLVARSQPFWIVGGFSTVMWGYLGTKFRTIREPLFAGFLCFTAAIVGLATIQPNDSTNAIVFSGLAGFGFGAPLILLITGVQLATPSHLIATATAVTTSSRAIAATVFTAVYAAALNNRLDTNLPAYIAKAAAMAGLPPSSIKAFVGALASNDTAALAKIAGVTPVIIGAGVVALKQAFADSVRVVYMIAAPFGALACIACFFLGDMRKKMDYRVDAPVEELHAKAAVSKA